MGWPYDGGLWRDNAKPAQEQYAAVAKAISEFEPLIMLADPEVGPQIVPHIACTIPFQMHEKQMRSDFFCCQNGALVTSITAASSNVKS